MSTDPDSPALILFAGRPEAWTEFEEPLTRHLDESGIACRLVTLDAIERGEVAPEQVDYIITAPNSELQDYAPYVNTRLVQNLWAGVERITGNETLTQPLARMVEEGMTRGMVEWVTGHVLRHHLDLDTDIARTEAEWRPRVPPLAQDRPVCILGLGELGTACATALAALGFDVKGWSRSPKRIEGIRCYDGEIGMQRAMTGAEILVLLVPLTPETENLLNAERIGWLAEGAVVINPGRGPLIDDDALLEALRTGAVGHATLDVFRTEPLPADHPYWHHRRVTVTPHIASHTRPETASRTAVENILRGVRAQPFEHLVDRDRGY